MKKTVLVVDDEKGFRDMYVYLLEPLGIEVTCVTNGQEAVQKIREKAFDLVLMDVHMPVMTGPEAIRQIHRIRPGQKVVVFSSSSDPTFRFEEEAKRLGVVECLYKPVGIDEIRRVLAKAFGDREVKSS